MSEVKVTNQRALDAGWEFVVHTQSGTNHTVRLEENYYQQLTEGDTTPEMLIKESLRFLLDRESAGAIHADFNLRDIEQYFPTYPEVISEKLS